MVFSVKEVVFIGVCPSVRHQQHLKNTDFHESLWMAGA